MGRIIEILILSFKKTEMEPVGFNFREEIGAEQNAVLKLQEELARGKWLTTQLRDTCAHIYRNIRVFFEHVRDLAQISSAFRNMRRDEVGFWMASEHTVSLFEQFVLRILCT